VPLLLSAHQLTKSFAARPLFRGLTFAVESGERIGLIGPNGAGKSTLLTLLAGRASPDEGTLSLQRGLKVGFLEQVPKFTPGATVFATMMEGAADAHDWDAMGRARELASRLGLDRSGSGWEEREIETLSGGWAKRVALARELVRQPDLLLLDEPTNHLDVETILWLEQFLARAPFALLTVTHDRLFLQRTCNRIIELDPRHPGGLLSVAGDYSRYVETREQLIAAQERREVILKNTLRRETEWLRQGAKARTTKQQARIHRAAGLKSEVEDLTARNQVRAARIDFQSAEKNPKKLLEAKGIAKSYGDRAVFEGLDLVLRPGTRLGLLGPNGSGKSTLIRTLIGELEPDAGEVRRSEHLQVAHFDQTRESLAPEVTLAKTLCPLGEHVDYRGSRVHIRGYLDRFLFTQQQMDMPVGRLSGGEQSRVLIARLMLKEANLLVLDEPTNDLDMVTLSVLEECLTEFPGAVVLVAHDRYFLDQVANTILAFPPAGGRLESFADLGQWEAWYARQPQADAPAPKTAKPAAPETPAPAPARKRRLGFKEQRELDAMEANIHAAEELLARLTAESALPENASNASALSELTRKMAAAQAEIDRLYARWAELAD
jgi:ATP-binding cassette subfamily F protein uup